MLTYQIDTPERRLSAWKEFRDKLVQLTPDEQLDEVASFFSKTPIGSRSLDFYTPDTWPTPWEILYDSLYCQSSISLLMYYTLLYMNSFKDRIHLCLIDDGEDRYLVPVIDDQFILNYELGAITILSSIEVTTVTDFNNNEIKQYT